MRILFLSWWWPYPADNGAKIRIYNLLKHLAGEHEVTLLSFAEPGDATPESLEHLRSFCKRVEAVPKPIYQPGGAKALLGYLSRWPRSLVDVYSPDMAARVQAALDNGMDVVVASQIQTMRYLELAPTLPVILEEAEVTVFHNQVESATGRIGRFRAGLTLSKLQNAIKSLMRRGASVTVVSESEQQYIRSFAPTGARIAVVPNGVDAVLNTPDKAIIPQPRTLIYSGAVTYNANYDAVAYFVREVWPLVRARVPDATFTVTGGTGKVDVSDLAAQPGVIFSGYLPSVASAVQSSWAMVTPLRVGGGTRLKILEAMALGTPVISTSKGAEGLAINPGHDILIADTPETMAEAVCTLFDNAAQRENLAYNARQLVEHQYDWSLIARQLLTLVAESVR